MVDARRSMVGTIIQYNERGIVMILEELQKRIMALRDIEEIKKMHRDYVLGVNNREFEKILNYFAENAIVEIRTYGRRKGKEEIERLFKEEIAKHKHPKGKHILIQPVISVEGQTAKGYWIMDLFSYESTSTGRLMATYETGRYDCKYVKEGGKWRFNYLRLRSPWPELKKGA